VRWNPEEHRVSHRLPGLHLRDSRFGIMEIGLASGGWGRLGNVEGGEKKGGEGGVAPKKGCRLWRI